MRRVSENVPGPTWPWDSQAQSTRPRQEEDYGHLLISPCVHQRWQHCYNTKSKSWTRKHSATSVSRPTTVVWADAYNNNCNSYNNHRPDNNCTAVLGGQCWWWRWWGCAEWKRDPQPSTRYSKYKHRFQVLSRWHATRIWFRLVSFAICFLKVNFHSKYKKNVIFELTTVPTIFPYHRTLLNKIIFYLLYVM